MCFPILDEALRSRVLAEAFELPLLDNQQAWALASDGSYARIVAGRKQPLRCQQALLDHHSERFTARPERSGAKPRGQSERRRRARERSKAQSPAPGSAAERRSRRA